MEPSSKLRKKNANMTFLENVPMAKMISPMDFWDLSTPKPCIKHMHLLGTSDHKLGRKNNINFYIVNSEHLMCIH